MQDTTRSLVVKESKGEDGLHQLLLEHSKLETPDPGYARVRVLAASLNRRDYWIRLGLYPGLRFDSVLGSDATGIVEAVGDKTNSEWIGRTVVINSSVGWGTNPIAPDTRTYGVLGMKPFPGTFAEYTNIPVSQLSDMPSHLSPIQAACLPVAGLTAWRALITKGEARRGSTVLVTGAGGGVAVFAIQFAVALGAKVWVTSSSDKKIEFCKQKLGAIGGANYTSPDWVNVLKQELEAEAKRSGTSGTSPIRPGFDCIIDGSGGSALSAYVGLLSVGGKYVVYGVTGGAKADNVNLAVLFLKQAELRGSTMGTDEEWRAMLQFVNEHKIVPLVDHVIAYEDYEKAFSILAQSQQMGKVVLAIGRECKQNKEAKL